MADFKNPIDQFIKELGGTVKVATALGVTPSVVSSWRSSGKIPNWRVEPVLKIAKKNGSVSVPEGLAA
jgi:hypothetical protein